MRLTRRPGRLTNEVEGRVRNVVDTVWFHVSIAFFMSSGAEEIRSSGVAGGGAGLEL